MSSKTRTRKPRTASTTGSTQTRYVRPRRTARAPPWLANSPHTSVTGTPVHTKTNRSTGELSRPYHHRGRQFATLRHNACAIRRSAVPTTVSKTPTVAAAATHTPARTPTSRHTRLLQDVHLRARPVSQTHARPPCRGTHSATTSAGEHPRPDRRVSTIGASDARMQPAGHRSPTAGMGGGMLRL
jgi:hypothetical protein